MTNNNKDNNYPMYEGSVGENEPKKYLSLVLYNDEINEFSYVIDCLIEVCDFENIQAEQLTMIAHNKGKANIKSGIITELEKIDVQLKKMGLTTEIKVEEGN
jgi:ATP-dependent Clp protease adaptor protein ClpS